jgi:hypothetical protein
VIGHGVSSISEAPPIPHLRAKAPDLGDGAWLTSTILTARATGAHDASRIRENVETCQHSARNRQHHYGGQRQRPVHAYQAAD